MHALHSQHPLFVSNRPQEIPRFSQVGAWKVLCEGCEQLCAEPGLLPQGGADPPAPLETVGRVRRDPTHPRRLWLWQVADNLRKGAATNAVQIAEAWMARQA